MAKFTQHTGLVAPLDKNGVDTDAIIPKQFLQKVTRSGFGQHLFHDWRFLDDDGLEPNPQFILNQPQYQKATILLTRENFGCGSSREHAPWALSDYGFKAIVGESFADIFYNNSFNNGLLLINLPSDDIAQLFKLVEENQGVCFSIDLDKQTLSAGERVYSFKIDGFKRHCLLNGLDSIGLTLEHEANIKAYEDNIPSWLG